MALSDQHKKDCSRYNRELVKMKEISDKLQRQVSSLTASNALRRLKTATEALAKEKGTTDQLKADIQALKQELLKLNGERLEKQRKSKNKTEQLRYHKLRRGKDQIMSEEENQFLRMQLKVLERENDQFKCSLDEIMNNREITTFENAQFNADIRVTCYETISKGVG